MNHAPNEPATPHDVACERWTFWRHFVVTAGAVACVWLMVRCSERWIEVEYRPEVKTDSVRVGK